MDVHAGELSLTPAGRLRRGHVPAADHGRGLGFERRGRARTLPRTLHTDEQRLQQILRNLLSNAVKFTELGRVRLRVEPVDRHRFPTPTCAAPDVVAFSVVDTGIGIAAEKLRVDLRGVPAGRRHHQPQVRRHRAGPVHQPGDRPPARRRDRGGEPGRAGQHLHPAACRCDRGPATAPHARRARQGGTGRLPELHADVPAREVAWRDDEALAGASRCSSSTTTSATSSP